MNESNKITGVIDHISEQSGTSKAGVAYNLRTLVIREVSGQYPQGAVIEAFGGKADHVQVGDLVDCYFNLKAREYNGKWYNTISAWKILKQGAVNTVAPEVAAPAVAEPTQAEAAQVAGLGTEPEDLPF